MTSRLKGAKEELRRAIEDRILGGPRRRGIARVEVPAPPVDLASWLAANPGGSRLFWSSRDGDFETAGVGTAETVGLEPGGDLRALVAAVRGRIARHHPRLRWYGGLSFDGTAPDPLWRPFGPCRFTLPRFEASRERDRWRLACAFDDDPALPARDVLRPLLAELAHLRTGVPAAGGLPAVVGRADHPDRAGWTEAVEGSLAAIRAGRLEKVVLARQTVFRLAGAPDPFLLLRRLREVSPEGFHFALQPDGGAAFLGASPERLYRRRRSRILTEAVAGTRRRGDSAREDEAIGYALLDAEKDRREHKVVADAVFARLGRLCVETRADAAVSLLRLSRLQHLSQRFDGKLRATVDDAEIIGELHPTPAVAGNPTPAAMAEIARREPFHRGWYAGPVGWVSPGGAEFAVAIRSGLAAGERLVLYTGAGIVEGSRPPAEWEELENKLAGFVRAIDAP